MTCARLSISFRFWPIAHTLEKELPLSAIPTTIDSVLPAGHHKGSFMLVIAASTAIRPRLIFGARRLSRVAWRSRRRAYSASPRIASSTYPSSSRCIRCRRKTETISARGITLSRRVLRSHRVARLLTVAFRIGRKLRRSAEPTTRCPLTSACGRAPTASEFARLPSGRRRTTIESRCGQRPTASRVFCGTGPDHRDD